MVAEVVGGYSGKGVVVVVAVCRVEYSEEICFSVEDGSEFLRSLDLGLGLVLGLGSGVGVTGFISFY